MFICVYKSTCIHAHCYKLNVSVPPPPKKIIDWKPNQLGGEVFGRCTDQKGRAPINGIVRIEKRPRRDDLSLLPREDRRKRRPSLRRHALTRHQLCQHQDLGLPRLQDCEEYVFVVYRPPRLWYPCHGGINRPKHIYTRTDTHVYRKKWLTCVAGWLIIFILFCISRTMSTWHSWDQMKINTMRIIFNFFKRPSHDLEQ